MSTSHANTEWIPQQVKVFSRWVSSHLADGHADAQVNDVTKDLSNGVALVELAQILIGKEAPRHWVHTPKRNVEMVTNSDLAIEMFTKDGVHFVGISGKDINDNKEKLILGLVWTLILHYSIGNAVTAEDKVNEIAPATPAASVKSNKDALMQWAIDRTSNYPNVKDFKPNDLSMCALLDSYVPDKINFYSLDQKDSAHNAELATSVMRDLGIHVYLDADDLQESNVDEKALLTQLSAAKVVLERLPPRVENTNVEEVVSNFNESTVTNEEVLYDHGAVIPQSLHDESNIVSSVQTFNESNQTFEEIDDNDAVTTRDVTDRKVDVPSPVAATPAPKADVDSCTTTSDDDVSDDVDVQSRDVEPEFVPHQVDGDNSQYTGRKFGFIMTLNETDYNHGYKMNPQNNELLFGEDVQFALTLAKDNNPYLNPAGRMLDLAVPNIEKDTYQQFTFGLNEWNTVIDSFVRQGMVWDVADELNTNPPAGTPFYVFPFHGRHNQHFVYKDNMIYATQNGMVVTYVGGDEPLVMMPPSNALRARQTFTIKLL